MVVGYIVSRTAVINDHESQQVQTTYRPVSHEQSELYATIRRSDEALHDASKKD